jgi:hypothetical protein
MNERDEGLLIRWADGDGGNVDGENWHRKTAIFPLAALSFDAACVNCRIRFEDWSVT